MFRRNLYGMIRAAMADFDETYISEHPDDEITGDYLQMSYYLDVRARYRQEKNWLALARLAELKSTLVRTAYWDGQSASFDAIVQSAGDMYEAAFSSLRSGNKTSPPFMIGAFLDLANQEYKSLKTRLHGNVDRYDFVWLECLGDLFAFVNIETSSDYHRQAEELLEADPDAEQSEAFENYWYDYQSTVLECAGDLGCAPEGLPERFAARLQIKKQLAVAVSSLLGEKN